MHIKMSARKKKWVKSAFSQGAKVQTSQSEESVPTENVSKRLKFDCTSEKRSEDYHKELNICSKADLITTISSISTSNWIDKFTPNNIDELAVHSKKISELQDWLKYCDDERKKSNAAHICLLTGPTGAGKTTAVRMVAKHSSYQVHEWINPIDCEVIHKLGDQNGENPYIGSQIEAFKSFLIRASRYKSLIDRCDKRLLLVEDFPNALVTRSDLLDDMLKEYTYYGKSPLIFIVTDSKARDLNINYNIFTEQLKAKYKINHVNFNPIATTSMQKAMKQFCSIVRACPGLYQVPSQNVIDSIVTGAQGDIRNALINFHFTSLKGAPQINTEIVTCERGKKSRKQQTTLSGIGRDESITMLHALGRVFNPKFNEQHTFLHSPETIAETFSTEPKKFIDLLHSNYLPHFQDIKHICRAINDLSISDVILCEYRENASSTIALNLGVRSIMVSNETPASGWMPVRAVKRCTKHIDEVESFRIDSNLSLKLFATEYRSFVKCIRPSNANTTQIES